jgi:hypothetical protein
MERLIMAALLIVLPGKPRGDSTELRSGAHCACRMTCRPNRRARCLGKSSRLSAVAPRATTSALARRERPLPQVEGGVMQTTDILGPAISRILSARFVPIGLTLLAMACVSTPAQGSRSVTVVDRSRLDSLAADPAAADRCRSLQSAAFRADAPPIYLASEVDDTAQMLSLFEQPGLPELPRRNGVAVVVVVVGATGRAQAASVHVVRASDEDLRTIVAAIAARARYVPAKRKGVAVAQCLVVPWMIVVPR